MPTIFASSTQYGNLSARKIDLDNSFYSITSNELLVPTPLCVYGKNSAPKKIYPYAYSKLVLVRIWKYWASNLPNLQFVPENRTLNLAKCKPWTTIQNHLPNGKLENSTCLSDSLKVIVLTSIISQQNSYIEKDKDCAILGFWCMYVVLLSIYLYIIVVQILYMTIYNPRK